MRFEKDSIEELKKEFRSREGNKFVSCRDVRIRRYLNFVSNPPFATSCLVLKDSECIDNNHIPEYGC